MSRPAKNRLHLVSLPNGRWLLHGYLNGKQIRKRSRNFVALEAEKLAAEEQVAKLVEHEKKRRELRMTELSEEALRDAEAATRLADGRTLTECVIASKSVLPPIAGKPCADALAEWLAVLKKRKRSDRTLEKNEARVTSFLEFSGAKHVQDIRPLWIERWIFRGDTRADYTRITDAATLRAWLSFCVRRRYLLVSPFEIDMKDLTATARTKEPARILTPEQCHALLAAARDLSNGRMLPYCILATWCFLSPQEVIRTTREKMKLDAATPVIAVETVKRRTAKYRNVTVPPNVLPLLREAVKDWPADRKVELSRTVWDRVRERAGIMQRNKAKNGRKSHRDSKWQSSILRHTGISYLHQHLSDKAQRGEFEKESVIAEVCRQAGNTTATAFAHYLDLPAPGSAARFYATCL